MGFAHLSLFALNALAPAVDSQGAAEQSSTLRTEYEKLMERPKPVPQIPAEFRTIVSAASPDLLTVRGLNGQQIAVDIEWYELSEYRLFQDGRFLGMSLRGYEDFGFYLVDRAVAGSEAVIATGDVPVFSSDGRFFAATALSEAGWSNLEGIAVWEVTPTRTIRLFFTDAVPLSFDWRIDSWQTPNCVSISSIPFDWTAPEGQDWAQAVSKAPRNHYGIEIGAEVVMLATHGQPACENGESR